MNFKLINYKLCTLIILTCRVSSAISTENEVDGNIIRQFQRIAKSADIKAYMNQNINPCDDFYGYACNKWRLYNPAQINGNINTDKFQGLTGIFNRKLHYLLQNRKNSTENDCVEDKIKNFYKSCLRTHIDKEKYQISLQELYNGFAGTEQQLNDTNFKWWSAVAEIQKKYGKSIILSQYAIDDMVYVGPPTTKMQIVLEKTIRKYMQSYLNVLPEDAVVMAKNILIVENKLTLEGLGVRLGKTEKDLVTLYNTTDLIEKYQNLFDVKEYLETVLHTKAIPSQVYIYNEMYFKGLDIIMNNTDMKIIKDYILWLFLEEYIIEFNDNGLYKKCTDKTKQYFGKYIDHIVYNQYRSNETETAIHEMWNDIKSIFRHNLNGDRYYWINNATRDEAIRKLDNMNLSINSYDSINFTEILQNVVIDPVSYVLNIQNILKNAEPLRENLLSSIKPIYNTLTNQIEIPVALLHPHYIFDIIYPKAIQYGAIGYLIAHEMMRGFNEEGRKYDANGSKHEWWDNKSVNEFESRRKCFEDQYQKYNYGGKPLSNFVEIGGINIAYDAYKHWLSKQKLTETNVETSETLPRLSVNNRQLFFLSFSQLWCEEIHSIFRSSFINGEIHAPGMYKVISALSNSREFSWIFKCDVNSKMNPAMKCEIF